MDPVRVIVGHANPDFDAYASTVAATKLFPGAHGVFLGSQNANVRAFHNLHEEFLDFVDLRGLDLDAVDSVVLVDTRDPSRVGELEPVVRREGVEVIVYDHHPPQEGDVTGADDRSVEVGATTSILVHEIKRRGIEVSALEASVMLLGIHEDTGSLTYPGTTAYDLDAAAWLMASGADIEVLNQFLGRTLDAAQRELLRQLEESLETWDINGQQIVVGTAVAEEYVDSASVLTHYVVEDMGFRVAIAIVKMPQRVQIVARSRLAEVDVGAVLARLGGGGHPQAASAGFRELEIADALVQVRAALEAQVTPPVRARDIMSSPVRTIGPETTMREAGELMARWGHGGLPVLVDGALAGLVTRKDVDKALNHRLEHAPAKGFMGRDLITVGPEEDLSSLERLLATRGIGRVPVVLGSELVGIVTRKDVLRAEHGDGYLDRRLARPHPKATEAFLGGVETLLPPDVRDALHQLGSIGDEAGITAHVVGGFVRDMVLGRRNLDIDVVVEGDGIAFAETVAERLGIRIKVHRRFGTAVLVFSRELHVDIASSRAEYYNRPGALPTVERSSLRQDLFRRDFTINAMSACLDPDCFGTISDPFGGLRDLKGGVVRIMHSLSFVDDPTRVLRAARFEERYGFSMDVHTSELAVRAVEMDLLDEVSGARLREELYDILDEGAPAEVLNRLAALGGVRALLPLDADELAAVRRVSQVQEAWNAFAERVKGSPSRRAALVAALAGVIPPAICERWIGHLRISRELAGPSRALAQRGSVVLRTLADARGMRDSRLRHLLEPLPAEAIVVLWCESGDVARRRIERHLDTVARVRPAVSGRDLIELGAKPSESFAAILAQALDDRLDERAVGREAEIANLTRLALRAGLISYGKDA